MKEEEADQVVNRLPLSLSESGSVWIVKPAALSCGRDIVVVTGLQQVLSQVHAMNYHCVVQKYIERPLLIRNQRKFDIRQWILVTELSPLIIYGFSECYLRLSRKPYSLDSNDRYVHLCNHSVQKDLEVDISTQGEVGRECDTMMTQHEFSLHLQSLTLPSLDHPHEDIYMANILPQIQTISIEAVLCCRDRLEKIGKGFEWLGLDLMVTEDLDVALIEVNVSPDTTCSTSVTARLVEPATRDLFDLVLDDQVASGSHRALGVVSEYIQAKKLFETDPDSMTQSDLKRLSRLPPSGVKGAGFSSITEQVGAESLTNSLNLTSEPLWQLWYVGKSETTKQVKEFQAKKASVGVLRDKASLLSSTVESSILYQKIEDFHRINESEDEI